MNEHQSSEEKFEKQRKIKDDLVKKIMDDERAQRKVFDGLKDESKTTRDQIDQIRAERKKLLENITSLKNNRNIVNQVNIPLMNLPLLLC